MLYVLFAWSAMVAICSLAVDFGRVSYSKAQLQCVADSAARAAFYSLPQGVTAAQNAAVAIAAANSVNGASVALNAGTDIAFGNWNSSTQTFTTLTGAQQSQATSVKVSLSLTTAKSNSIPLLFACLIGQSTCNITASSVAGKPSTLSITNSGFESPALSYGQYVYDQAMPGWTLTGYACLATYGSAWCMSSAPDGAQVVSLQGYGGSGGSISQTFSATAGTYNISFLGAARPAYYQGTSYLQPVKLTVDSTQIALIAPFDGTFRTYNTPTFTLTAGSHTLTMASTDFSGDKSTFVDDVAINNAVSNVAQAK
jgi:Flp pilus assembly protein TadG